MYVYVYVCIYIYIYVYIISKEWVVPSHMRPPMFCQIWSYPDKRVVNVAVSNLGVMNGCEIFSEFLYPYYTTYPYYLNRVIITYDIPIYHNVII